MSLRFHSRQEGRSSSRQHPAQASIYRAVIETLESRQLLSAAPSDLDATIVSSTRVDLVWSDNSNDETGFKIERRELGGSWGTLTTTASDIESFSDTTATAATQYAYRVKSVDGGGDSAPSNEDSVATPKSLIATADTYVRDGGSASTNYGTSTLLEVKKASSGYNRYAYLKFDMSSVSSVASGKVRIYGANNGGDNELAIYAVSTTSWSETGMTWNNKPSDSGTSLGTVTINGTAQWHEFDVSSYLQSEKALGHNTVSFVIKSLTTDASGIDIHARDKGSNPVEMVVTPTVVTLPSAPSNMDATAASATQINLAWTDNSNNETSFKIERKTGSGGSWAQIDTASANTTSYSDTTVSADTRYYYRIRSTNDAGDSSYSNEDNAKTPEPSSTASLTATADGYVRDGGSASTNYGSATALEIKKSGSGFNRYAYLKFDISSVSNISEAIVRVYGNNNGGDNELAIYSVGTTNWAENTLTWNNKPSDGGTALDTVTGNGTAQWLEFDVTSYIQTEKGLGHNTVGFVIKSVTTDASGIDIVSKEAASNKPQLAIGMSVVPAAPSDLVATAVSPTQIDLAWEDNSAIETQFNIERKTGSGGSWTQIDTVNANVESYEDDTVSANTQYYYRVRASNGAGDSGYSDEDDATTPVAALAAPSGLDTTVVSSTRIDLEWVDNSSNEDGFSIQRKTAGGNWQTIDQVGENVTEYVDDNGLSEGVVYLYQVRAENTSDNSTYTTEESATTYLKTPKRLASYGYSTPTEQSLHWIDMSSLETGYRVERSPGGTNWTALATLGPNEEFYYDGGLTEVTTYHYRVTALGSAVNSLPVQTTASTEPESSFDLQAEVGIGEVSLEWTNNSPGVSMTYLIRRRIWGGSWIDLDTTGIGITSYIDETVEESTDYQYRVYAMEDAERVQTSFIEDAFVPLYPPTDLTATAVSDSEINLTWTDVSQKEASHKLQISTDGTSFSKLATIEKNATDFQVSDLDANETYYFRLYRFGGGSSSAYSNIASDTTPIPALDAPVNLEVTQTTGSTIDLKWEDASDEESGYVIEQSTDGVRFVVIDEVAAGTTSYSAEDLDTGKAYRYRVRAQGTGNTSSVSSAVSAVARDPEYVQEIAGYTVVDAPIFARLVSGDLGPTSSEEFDDDASPLFGYSSSWLNVDNEPLTAFSGLTGFNLGDRGFGNLIEGTEVEMRFDKNGLVNGPGDDLVIFSAYGDGGGESNSRGFFISVGNDLFEEELLVETSDFVNHTSDPLQPWWGQFDVNGSSVYSPGYLSTCAIDLSDLGIPEGEPVELVRVDEYDEESDLLGIGSLNAAPDLQIDSNNDGKIDKTDDGVEEGEPGKLIAVNDDDSDGDEKIDFADFDGIDTEQFIPLEFRLPIGTNVSSAKVKFGYSASDPNSHGENDTLPTNGNLRLWTKEGSEARDKEDDFIVAGQSYDVDELPQVKTGLWRLWVEAVKPSATIGDQEITLSIDPGGNGNFVSSDEVRLTSLRTKESWQKQALENADLDLASWTPASGFPANELNVRKVYAYYTGLYNSVPDKFLWAGLAKLAGGAVFSGLELEHWFIQDAIDHPAVLVNGQYVPNPNAALSLILVPQEKLILAMQQDIFQDLAWQHEAYKDVGLFALSLLPTLQTTLVPGDIAIAAWNHIDSSDVTDIKLGNKELLNREQDTILQPRYNELMAIQGYGLSYFTPSPIPGGQSFTAVMGITADIAEFEDRWEWITTDMLPIWESATSLTRGQWVNSSLGSLVQN